MCRFGPTESQSLRENNRGRVPDRRSGPSRGLCLRALPIDFILAIRSSLKLGWSWYRRLPKAVLPSATYRCWARSHWNSSGSANALDGAPL
jgi:hypothetical protein